MIPRQSLSEVIARILHTNPRNIRRHLRVSHRQEKYTHGVKNSEKVSITYKIKLGKQRVTCAVLERNSTYFNDDLNVSPEPERKTFYSVHLYFGKTSEIGYVYRKENECREYTNVPESLMLRDFSTKLYRKCEAKK